MSKLQFRELRADEIECRVAMAKDTGVQILLYKDARCDMNILDETVGPLNWQRFHSRENANCTVQIWDEEKRQWISKEDTGKESNTEAEKGLASDSFKRACFNWGIGRALYTAPFVWIGQDKCKMTASAYNGRTRYNCYDKFKVEAIKYREGVIICLSIINENTKKRVFVMDERTPEEKAEHEKQRKAVAGI